MNIPISTHRKIIGIRDRLLDLTKSESVQIDPIIFLSFPSRSSVVYGIIDIILEETKK